MGIKITSLELREVSIPFRFSYTHALASRSEATAFVLAATTDDGRTGYGEAIPRSYLTGETGETVRTDVLGNLWQAVRNIEASSYAELYRQLFPIYEQADAARRNSAYAAVEMACVDAFGKSFAAPAREFALVAGAASTATAPGGETAGRNKAPSPSANNAIIASSSPSRRKLCISCSGPVGTRKLQSAVRLSKLFRMLHFRDVKLKVGFADDAERIAAVRQAVGGKMDLRLDANCGWTYDQALALADCLAENQISSIEQPFPAQALADAARFRKSANLIIMADESLCSREDARKLIAAEACDIFNLRLGKCGGFIGCAELLKMARAHSLDAQLGVLVGETTILTSAGQEFLAASGALRHHECSFPKLLLKNNPAWGEAGVYWRGIFKSRPARPGLGIKVKQSILNRITVRRDVISLTP